MKKIKHILLFTALAVFAIATTACNFSHSTGSAKRSIALKNHTDTLIILHTNDTHSQLEPERTGRNKGLGGVHRRAAYFDQQIEHYGRGNVLLLDAGDYNQGTPYFTVFKGDIEIEMFNSLGYDAVALGNHEFDNGQEELARRLKMAKFPSVCANYDFKGTPLEGLVKPYVIVKKAGKKIGIIGLTVYLPSCVTAKAVQGLKYENPIAVANKYAMYLKEQKKCDFVIVLSHLGYTSEGDLTSDVDVARNSENIDIIVGGHSHTFLKEDKVYKNLSGKDVHVLQTGAHGIYVGKMEVTF